MENSLVKVGISVGDINGIGMEVIIKALSDARILQTCAPVVFGSPKLASFYRKQLNIQDFSFNFIKGWDSINQKQPSLYVTWEEEINIEPGADVPLGGAYALRSLDAGIQALIDGHIDVLVTAPVNKHNIKSETGIFRGHTEYLGEKFGKSNPVMMMVSDSMRIVPVTGHIALSEVSGKIVAKVESIFMNATDFSPKIKDSKSKKERVFELRTYTANAGKLPDLLSRFRDHTLKLFKKHGMTNVAYWTVNGKDDTLIYILAHPSEEDGKKAFDAFRADPVWVKARDESEKNGKLTTKVESVYMKATDFSTIK
jgi:hypothetical protein